MKDNTIEIMINYSIIVPHKNIPKLLQRCLDSIPQRNDLEVIVVDDNSNPDIVNFDDFPGFDRKDTTIIFDKSGKGAGRARNIGLQYAQGKWLLFADSDDYFNYCFNDMLNLYKEDSADIIYFFVSSVDCETYINSGRADAFNDIYKQYLDNNIEAEGLIRYIVSAPWGKFIKRSLIINNQISCEETSRCNDVRFSYLIGYYANTLKVDEHAIYCLTSRSLSLSNTISEEKIVDKIRVFARRERFLKEHKITIPRGNEFAYLETLVSVAESGNVNLYNRCLNELSMIGISQSLVEKMVQDELLKRKYEKEVNLISLFRNPFAFISKLRSFFCHI